MLQIDCLTDASKQGLNKHLPLNFCADEKDVLLQELRAGVLKPSYVLVRDEQLRSVVLAVRGTHSFKDMFTSLTGTVTFTCR